MSENWQAPGQPEPPNGQQQSEPPNEPQSGADPRFPPPPPGFGFPGGFPPPGAQAGPGPSAGQPGYGTPGFGTPGYGAPPGPGPQPGGWYGQPYGQPGYQQAGPGAYGPYAPQGPRPPEIGEAVGWSWAKFRANLGSFLGMAAVEVAAVMVFIGFFLAGYIRLLLSIDQTTGEGSVPDMVSWIMSMSVGSLVLVVLGIFWQPLILRGALKACVQPTVSFRDFFDTTNLGRYIVAALAIGAIEFVAACIPFLGSIGVIFLEYGFFFVPLLVFDQAMPLGQAIQTSWKTTYNGQNAGPLILLGLIFGLISSGGAMVLIVGMLITMPLVALGQVYTYKRTFGLPVLAAGELR